MNQQRRDRTAASTPAADRAKTLFEGSVERLDAGAANRLRLMRREALASPGVARRWAPAFAGGALAMSLAAIAWWPQAGPPGAAVQANVAAGGPAAASLEPTTLSEDEALMYAWLADAPVAGGADEAGSL